jgi:hypothetical protein
VFPDDGPPPGAIRPIIGGSSIRAYRSCLSFGVFDCLAFMVFSSRSTSASLRCRFLISNSPSFGLWAFGRLLFFSECKPFTVVVVSYHPDA